MTKRAEQNQIKYENYRILMNRYNAAVKGGFQLEAVFIAYAAIEDRLSSLFKHAGFTNPDGSAPGGKRGNEVKRILGRIITAKTGMAAKAAAARNMVEYVFQGTDSPFIKVFCSERDKKELRQKLLPALDDLESWRTARNDLAHKLLSGKINYDDVTLTNLAIEGGEIMGVIGNAVAALKRSKITEKAQRLANG